MSAFAALMTTSARGCRRLRPSARNHAAARDEVRLV